MNDGERAAFDEFVHARLPRLLRFGHALTGDPHSGADLVQDALERAMLAWSRIDSKDDPEWYVRRIMVNRNVSIWRRHRKERLTDEPPSASSGRRTSATTDSGRRSGSCPPSSER